MVEIAINVGVNENIFYYICTNNIEDLTMGFLRSKILFRIKIAR